MVLIHVWPLSAQAWEPQVSALREAGCRVVAYARRGFGCSDKPASGHGYVTLADDLQRVMDQCNLQDATLAGFAMGGGETVRYITRHGESRLSSVLFALAAEPAAHHPWAHALLAGGAGRHLKQIPRSCR